MNTLVEVFFQDFAGFIDDFPQTLVLCVINPKKEEFLNATNLGTLGTF